MINPDFQLSIASFPFNYAVVEQVFDKGTSQALSIAFQSLIQTGKHIGKVGEVGDLVYDAINVTPTISQILSTPIQQLASQEIKSFVASIFDIVLDENLIIGMHQHRPPSKPGWAHTDFAVVSFPNTPPNHNGLRLFSSEHGVNYSDDSRDRQPNSIKTARSIACIYYVGNAKWNAGMGGETGVFLADGKTLFATVPPRNNSLFLFEISPVSYHAYMGSQTHFRNSYIWWYHSAPGYLLHRHMQPAKYKSSRGLDPWDRWTDATVEKYAFETMTGPER